MGAMFVLKITRWKLHADNNQFLKLSVVLLYCVQQTVFWTQNKRLFQVSITGREHVNAVILYQSSIVSISFHVIFRRLQNYITHLLS